MSSLVVDSPCGGVVELRLNRPERRNAVTTELLRRLDTSLTSISEDRTVKVVVLTGEGPSFCAGADLDEFTAAADPFDTLARLRLVIRCIRGLLELEPVSIAAVHGGVIGAGWGIALGCDITWAAERTVLRLPEVAKGLRVPRPLVTRLAQVVGPIRAAEIVLGGAPLDLDQAVALGIVTRRHPDADACRSETLAFAESLAAQPRRVLAAVVDPLRRLAVPSAVPDFEYQWPESGV